MGTARAPGTSGVQEARTDTWGLTQRNGVLRSVGVRWSPFPATTAVLGAKKRDDTTVNEYILW